MQTKPRSISPKLAVLSAGVLCSLLMIVGCSKNKIAGPRTQSPERVAIEDFIGSQPETDAESSGSDVEPSGIREPVIGDTQHQNAQRLGESDEGIVLSAQKQPAQSTRVLVDVVPVSSPDRVANSTGSLTLLEAKVGDVNGKPIFTNSFFEPIEDRIIAESTRLGLAQWRLSTGQIVASRLNGIITDELLRAEALTALTPTQRVGLQAFLGNFRNNILSKNLGSAQLASRRIKQEEGMSLKEALHQKEIDTLVQLTLITEVNRRVNVSWRDIKQRYERDIDKYSPPPTANLRVIRAFKSNTETVDKIAAQLEEGVDFLKIAAGPLNNYNTDADGFHSVLIEDSFEATKFFGADILNEKTQQLVIGESVGPIELGSTLYWIKLMNIKQESISLYDAQLQIQQELTFERRRQAQEKYLGRLMERARVSSRDEVLMRLLEIAEERYGPKS